MSQMQRKQFGYVAGSTALDFVNTASWRDDGSIAADKERLFDLNDVIRWAEEGKVLKASEARQLRKLAKEDPRRSEQELIAARVLRRTLRDLFSALANGKTPDASLLKAFNRAVCDGRHEVDLVPAGGTFAWRFGDCRDDLAVINRLIAWDAAQLATSDRLQKLRECASPNCGWLFLDESRRGNRRWCSMDDCGSRAKAKRYYERKKGE